MYITHHYTISSIRQCSVFCVTLYKEDVVGQACTSPLLLLLHHLILGYDVTFLQPWNIRSAVVVVVVVDLQQKRPATVRSSVVNKDKVSQRSDDEVLHPRPDNKAFDRPLSTVGLSVCLEWDPKPRHCSLLRNSWCCHRGNVRHLRCLIIRLVKFFLVSAASAVWRFIAVSVLAEGLWKWVFWSKLHLSLPARG